MTLNVPFMLKRFVWNADIEEIGFDKHIFFHIDTTHGIHYQILAILAICGEKSNYFFSLTIWLVSLLVDQRVPEGTCSQVLRSTSVDL